MKKKKRWMRSLLIDSIRQLLLYSLLLRKKTLITTVIKDTPLFSYPIKIIAFVITILQSIFVSTILKKKLIFII